MLVLHTASLRVGGRADRRRCLPGLRRGGGGRQAGATVLLCLAWRCENAFSSTGQCRIKVSAIDSAALGPFKK